MSVDSFGKEVEECLSRIPARASGAWQVGDHMEMVPIGLICHAAVVEIRTLRARLILTEHKLAEHEGLAVAV